jgi:hypothetical protein
MDNGVSIDKPWLDLDVGPSVKLHGAIERVLGH